MDIKEKAIALVLKLEGGFVDDIEDRGGPTKFGISQQAYPALNIADLTEHDAHILYEQDYWKPLRCSELPPGLALAVFDCGVNQGLFTAVTLLQKSLRVKVDGIVGNVTLKTAEESAKDPDFYASTMIDFFVRRALRYVQTPTWEKFGRGWMVRLFTVYRAVDQLSCNSTRL